MKHVFLQQLADKRLQETDAIFLTAHNLITPTLKLPNINKVEL